MRVLRTRNNLFGVFCGDLRLVAIVVAGGGNAVGVGVDGVDGGGGGVVIVVVVVVGEFLGDSKN